VVLSSAVDDAVTTAAAGVTVAIPGRASIGAADSSAASSPVAAGLSLRQHSPAFGGAPEWTSQPGSPMAVHAAMTAVLPPLPAADDDGPWVCSTCTFENEPGGVVCRCATLIACVQRRAALCSVFVVVLCT
jgi:hypothetical protein